jgi:hypothetical protein
MVIVEKLPRLRFFHADVDVDNNCQFITKIINEDLLHNLQTLFLSRSRDSDSVRAKLGAFVSRKERATFVWIIPTIKHVNFFFLFPTSDASTTERDSCVHSNPRYREERLLPSPQGYRSRENTVDNASLMRRVATSERRKHDHLREKDGFLQNISKNNARYHKK